MLSCSSRHPWPTRARLAALVSTVLFLSTLQAFLAPPTWGRLNTPSSRPSNMTAGLPGRAHLPTYSSGAGSDSIRPPARLVKYSHLQPPCFTIFNPAARAESACTHNLPHPEQQDNKEKQLSHPGFDG